MRIVERALRAPMLVKLVGANLLIVLAVLGEELLLPGGSVIAPLIALLGASFAATAGLVWLALRPIAQLDATAQRVSEGDFGARVPQSQIADASVQRLSVTMNRLLDRVQADRARIEYLAGRSVRARDIEREAVARELRDSFAQMVTAIAIGLSTARRTNTNPAVDGQLEATRQLVDDLSEQMRGVAEALYPGTISEFGLPNALRALGRVVSRRSGVTIIVDAEPFPSTLTPQAAAALYRVADEALRNVAQHSRAQHASVELRANGRVQLEVVDDGQGFDLRERDPLQAGLGLFSAKTVLALEGGDLQISGAPGRGTRVVAHIPR